MVIEIETVMTIRKYPATMRFPSEASPCVRVGCTQKQTDRIKRKVKK